MATGLSIVKIKRKVGIYFDITVKNTGNQTLPSGTLKGKVYKKDGTVEAFDPVTGVDLSPGESTVIIAKIHNAKEVKITSFDATARGAEVYLNVTLRPGFLSDWAVVS